MKNSSNIKSKVINSLFWKFAERIGVQGTQFIISIVLARLLLPQDYGVIALTTIFISIANIFVQSGFGTALIQKADVDDSDFCTVFYFNLLISIVVYGVLYMLAPFMARFYNMDIFVNVLRVISLSIIIDAIAIIQKTTLEKNLQFKKNFYANIGGTIATAIVGITLAYLGLGIWALVFSQLANSLVTTITLIMVVRWKPRLTFSINRLKSLFKFGFNILTSSFISTIFDNLYSLVIGKLYSKEFLAYYNKGQSIPLLIINNINGTISSVIFPALSSVQDRKERLKTMLRRMIVTSSFIIFPLLFGMIAVARPLVVILLTEKWLPCVPFLQIACFTYMFVPINLGNLQALNAVGRSDLYLKLELLKKVLLVIVLIASIPFGIYVMLIASAVLYAACVVINAWPNAKILNYSVIEQIKDIMPSLILSIIMCISVLLIGQLKINIYALIILQVITGVLIYSAIAYLLKFECLYYILDILRKKMVKE